MYGHFLAHVLIFTISLGGVLYWQVKMSGPYERSQGLQCDSAFGNMVDLMFACHNSDSGRVTILSHSSCLADDSILEARIL